MRKLLATLGVAVTTSLSIAHAKTPEVIGGLSLPNTLASSCYVPHYQDKPTYDSPGGLRTGALKVKNPQALNQPCPFPQKTSFYPTGSSVSSPICTLPLPSGEKTLCVYQKKTIDNKTWYQGGTQYTRFWVESDKPFHSLTESLITGVTDFEEICSESGSCYASPYPLRAAIEKAFTTLNSPCAFPYLVQNIITLPSGTRAYHLSLDPSLRADFSKSLPDSLIVPVYKSNGNWTGMYEPKGCDAPENNLQALP